MGPLSFRAKDNFTFKCHRSNGTNTSAPQDIYAVRFRASALMVQQNPDLVGQLSHYGISKGHCVVMCVLICGDVRLGCRFPFSVFL